MHEYGGGSFSTLRDGSAVAVSFKSVFAVSQCRSTVPERFLILSLSAEKRTVCNLQLNCNLCNSAT